MLTCRPPQLIGDASRAADGSKSSAQFRTANNGSTNLLRFCGYGEDVRGRQVASIHPCPRTRLLHGGDHGDRRQDLPGSLAGGAVRQSDRHVPRSDVPACGFSLGLERILVVMQERGMFPPDVARRRSTLWSRAGRRRAGAGAMDTAAELRAAGDLRVDSIPMSEEDGQGVQARRSAPCRFIAIVGSDEVAAGTVTCETSRQATKKRCPGFERLVHPRRYGDWPERERPPSR